MSELKFPHLYEPILLGGQLFRNRIFAAPTGHHEMTPDCFPDAEVVAYYANKAKGGAASVCVGDCIVDTLTGQSHVKQIHIDDPLVVPPLTAVATAISSHGAVASAELSHDGKYSHVPELVGGLVGEYGPCLKPGQVGKTYGPMETFSKSGHPIKQMDEEFIWYIIERFGNAARVAKHCGFGMVTIHGGHGWLLSQFASPFENQRTDQWGGSFENRMRFTIEVIKSVRKAVGPRFPIEFRMSGNECFDGGYDLDYGVKIAQAIDGLVDLIHVSAGNHEGPGTFVITHPSQYLEDGVNVKYAAEIKKHVKTPVACVGALSDPYLMEDIIASGKADVVQMARELLVDPAFPNKVRAGEDEDVHRCMRCETCFSYAFTNRYHRCAINPKLGTYVDNKYEIPAANPQNVLVIGGGVGGMQAALTCAQRGHKVALYEKDDRLGGVLNCERGISFKKNLVGYLDRQARLVEKAGVEIHLGEEMTPEKAEALKPDAIIVSIGSDEVVPPVPGIDRDNVYSASQIHENPALAGENVVILGGGLVGQELAIRLAMEGKKCTIVEMLPALNNGGNVIIQQAIDTQLKNYDIKIAVGTRATEAGDGYLKAEGPDGAVEFKADTIVYAAGRKPKTDEVRSFMNCAPRVEFIGDCRLPRVIADANREAYYIARDIGV